MKKKVLFPVVSVLLLFAAACSDDDKKQDEPNPPVPEEPAPEKETINLGSREEKALRSSNVIGQEIFQSLCAEASVKGKNIVFSPLAVNMGLTNIALLNLSVADENVLDPGYTMVKIFGSDYEPRKSLFSELQKKLPLLDSSVRLNYSSSLWCDEAFYGYLNIDGLKEANVDVVVVTPPKTDTDEAMVDYVNGWLADKVDNTVGFSEMALGQNATLASVLKIEADWAESTESVGTGLLLQYREKAQVVKGPLSYAVRVPLGSDGSFEAVVVKANPGVDIDDLIASGEVFAVTAGEFAEQAFTVGFPVGTLTTSPNLPFDKVMAKLVEKSVDADTYEEKDVMTFNKILKFFALGSLSFGKEGMIAGGGSVVQHTSRSVSEGVESGFINIADGNCVLFVNEISTGVCLCAARIVDI